VLDECLVYSVHERRQLVLNGEQYIRKTRSVEDINSTVGTSPVACRNSQISEPSIRMLHSQNY
jgi:hypothetical protein